MAVELGAAYISILPSTAKLAAAVAGEFSKIEADAKATGAKIGAALETKVPAADSGGLLSSLRSMLGPVGAIGVGIGAALVGGIKLALDREAGSDLLAAQLGLGPYQSKRLGRIAGEVYSNAYGESLEGVNDALRQVFLNVPGMAQAGDIKLQAFTQKVLDQVALTGEGADRITATAGQLIKTGVADSAAEAMDIITTGFQEGLNKNDDFLDTLNEYGTQFRKLGLDGESALNLLSQGMQAGARDSDIVADILKEFSIRAVDGSKLTRKSFEALGLDAQDMTAKIAAGGPRAAAGLDQTLTALRDIEDPAERAQLAVGLFGTQAEDMGDALFALDLTTPKNQIDDIKGAAYQAGVTMAGNSSTRITAWYRTVKTKVTDFIAAVALPALRSLTNFVNEKVGPALRRAVEFAKKGEWERAWNQIKPILRTVWEWVKEHTATWGDQLADIAYDVGVKMGGRLAEGIKDSVPDAYWNLVNPGGASSSEQSAAKDDYYSTHPDERVESGYQFSPGYIPSGPAVSNPNGSRTRPTIDNSINVEHMHVQDERALRRRQQARSRVNQPMGVG